jgi:hypothetical protein
MPVIQFRTPSDVVIESTLVVELREQLLVRERELDEQENALLAREHDMVEAERALGRAHMECATIHDWVRDAQQGYQSRLHA